LTSHNDDECGLLRGLDYMSDVLQQLIIFGNAKTA
jgi:hypothetical protein